MFSSYSAGGRGPIRTLDVSYAKLFVTLACCLIIALAGCGFSSNSSSAGPLSVSPGSISFGAVPVGQTATTQVLILNETSAPVAVSQVNVSGQNFFLSSQSNLPTTINGGSVANFQIGFKPGNSSSYSGQFTVMGPGGKQIYVGTISGQGVGDNGNANSATSILTVSAANLAFGNLTVGTASTQSVTLASTGTAPVTISSATLSGTGFTLSGGAFPDQLKPGQSLTLNVQFDPTIAGAASGQLTIQSDSVTNSTAVVNLSGTGMPVASPQLTLSTANLTFGNVTVNTSSKQPVTLTSTGTAPVTINAGTLAGNGFTMSGATFPVTLNPSQSVTLNVQFDPTASGPASGQLTILSNSSSNSNAVVNLSGTGSAATSPQLTLSAASLTFGNVTVNSASTLPETLTSMGTAPVTINSATPSGTGFAVSGATFPVTLNPGQSVTLKVQCDPTAPGAASGQLTIQSNSSTNGTAVVNLSGTGTTATSPQLTLSAASLTFGNVTVNTASTQPVTLTSTGTAPVTINSAALTGTGFTMSGATFPVTLNPSQSVTLNVQFDPTTTGAASGQLTIQSDSSTNSTAVVNLSGTGTAATSPQLTLSAASLTFGDVTVNSASTQPVTLTSTGTAPVTINSAATSGTVFTVSGATFPVTLNPGQSVTLNAQFEPTATGAATDQLTIQSDSSTNSTAVVSLSGTGTAATSPQLTLSAVSLIFGDVTLNTASTQPVTLTSTGTAPVTINSATLTGTGFTVSGATFPVTFNPGQSVTLNVQFDPTTTGAASGQLTIQSDSSTNSTAVVNLSGTGTATVVPNPQLTISPASLAFGNVTVNTASTLPVTLTSTGTAPVTINSATLTGTGFTMSAATFPVTLNPTQSVTLNVQFDPATAGAATGQLTVQSNSTTNGTAVIGLTGTGTAVPGVLSGLSCTSASMTGAGSDTCTVTLSSAAGSGGVSVGLTSSSASVTVPATVVVPANATSAGFTATVSSVTTAQSVTLTASAGGVSKTFALQLNAAVPTLTISPASLAFGNVTVNTASTLPVTLTSTGTAPVTINSATLTGTGFTMSGATFPVTLNPSLAITLDVQFDPTATGAVTGQLTIQSNSSTNATVMVGLSGTGSASHQVTLTWDAPSSSTDPVAGYHVYRSTGGSSAYQLLNSSADTQTTYVDTNVQSGTTYDYIVKSVDASGVESTASNEATATIP
ncbi:MAG: choice-of-anchor D domain-containing protein [Acidobacteriaceae bacterium]